MWGRGRRTSRSASLLKLLLPILALGVLSTLFLFPEPRNGQPGIPYAQTELDEIAREMRLGAPRYSSVTSDGTAIVISAAEAVPEPGRNDAATAQRISARLQNRAGLTVRISAPEGSIDAETGTATLTGGTSVETGNGYRLDTETLVAALDRTRLDSAGPVTGDGPVGTLEAGLMMLRADPADPGRHVLVFNDRVRVIYTPQD